VVNFDAVPGSLKLLRQWCLRVGKQPFVKGGASGTFSPSWSASDFWMTFEEAHHALQDGAKCRVDDVLTPADGLGIIMARHEQDGHQLVGGDLDCCRDPETGWTSPWAEAWLKKLATYTEVSPSGCGYRFFIHGDLPDGAASLAGGGPDDLTEEAKIHILAAKPTVAEKLRKGQISWCGVELYTARRHLTITGNCAEGYPKTVESRAEAVLDLVEEISSTSPPPKAARAAKQGGNRLPPLDILQVIDTTGPDWSYSGGQRLGPHPTLGSTTGRNLVVKPDEGVYCWMHDGINAGGDSWIYLACECGAVPWEQAGPGTLKDPAVMKVTKEWAVKRGLVSPEDVGLPAFDLEFLKTALEANPHAIIEEEIRGALATWWKTDRAVVEVFLGGLKKAKKLPPGLRLTTVYADLEQRSRRSQTRRSGGSAPNRYEGVDLGGMTKRLEDTDTSLKMSPSMAAKTITCALDLCLDRTDSKDKPDLWRYDGGIWKKDGEREVVKLIDETIGDISDEHGLRETLRRIRNTSEAVQFNADPALFPTLDGVVDLKTGEFREARPEDYLTFRHNVTYNLEGADYRPFLWFLCSSLPDPRDVLTTLDIVTAVALRVPLDIIVLLFGGGANGKGIFEKVMLALFNSERSTALQLDELAKSRFGPGALLNKDLWIVSEVESVKDATSALKKVATGELIDTDVKYGGRVTGRPHLVPILDANLPFSFRDDSYGRKRRIVKLDFPFTFGDDPGTLPRDPHLEDKLTRPQVLAGIAQIIAARAPSLLETRRVYRRRSTEEQEAEYKRQRFSLSFFCDECLGTEWEDPDRPAERLLVDRAYAEYLEYCRLFHVTAPAECVPFGKYIKERFNSTSIATRERGEGIRYYPGVFLLKSARLAHAEFSLNNRSNSTATEEQQKEDSKTPISSWIATEATEELLIEVYKEIEKMFRYLSKYRDTNSSTWRDFVSYEDFRKTPVASVADDCSIAISPQTPCCSSVAEAVEDPLILAGELDEAWKRTPPPASLKRCSKATLQAVISWEHTVSGSSRSNPPGPRVC